MIRKILVAFLACATVAMTAAGCGNSAAQSSSTAPSSSTVSSSSTVEVSSSEVSSAPESEAPSEAAEPVEEGLSADGKTYAGGGVTFAVPEGFTLDDTQAPQYILKPDSDTTGLTSYIVMSIENDQEVKKITAADIKDLEKTLEDQVKAQGGTTLGVEEIKDSDVPTVRLMFEISANGLTLRQAQFMKFSGKQILACYYSAPADTFDAGLSAAQDFAKTVKVTA